MTLRPVGFDRVLEQRCPASASTLLCLPTEILGIILESVDSSSLAALALVNSDCRQLARSRQFVDVHLDYNLSSAALLRLLLSETQERRLGNGSTLLPALGVCIRRLTVSVDINTIRQESGIDMAGGRNAPGLTLAEVEDQRWKSMLTIANESYIPLLQEIFGFSKTMPHLEILDWQLFSPVSQYFYNALSRSSVRRLKLCHPISEGFELGPSPSLQPQFWPLRTLHLDITCDNRDEEAAGTLCTSILRLCAPSLETLRWINRRRTDRQTFGDGPSPHFPCLRDLHLQSLEFDDNTITDAFLSSRLVNVNLDLKKSVLDRGLGTRGMISSLEALSFTTPPLGFLSANTQISKLDLGSAVLSSKYLELEILPILSTFTNLKSLRISWPQSCSVLPEIGLSLIGRLHAITQLCISCGRMRDWRRTWIVDHEAIRQHLSPLQHLQRLALIGDTYVSNNNSPEPERYYEATFATRRDIRYGYVPWNNIPSEAGRLVLDPELGKPYWEKTHKSRMGAEGNKYAHLFPGLEWAYFGQRMILLQGDGDSTNPRGPYSIDDMPGKKAFLNRVFGVSPESYDHFRAENVGTRDGRDDIGL